jgi:monofunctional chorismate mutase
VAQNLESIRKKIDKVDDEIVNLLGKRKDLVKEVAEIKKSLDKKIFDKSREQQLIEKLRQKAREKNIDEGFICSLYRVILKNSKEEQEKIIRSS